MKITVDKEGLEVIQSLCDVALKTGGVSNLQAVNIILNSTKQEEDEKETKKGK